LTGKGISFGGSLIRPEATGYGDVYFAQAMLETKGDSFKGKTVVISGSGNVAQYAAEKATQLGGKVVTLSDSAGYIYDADGIDAEKLAHVMQIKNVDYARISEYVKKYPNAKYVAGKRPWEVKCDVALPCATQNELNEDEAKTLLPTDVSVWPKVPTCLLHQKQLRYSPKPKSFSHQEKRLTQEVLQLQV
jgi:glutamate dehydrogenase (NADP+)